MFNNNQKKTSSKTNRTDDYLNKPVRHPEIKDVHEDGVGKEERTMVWNAAKNEYVLFKKKTWKRSESGRLVPERSDYFGTDGVLQTSNVYEQTDEGFFGTAITYAYANGKVVRRTDDRQQFINGNWVPITDSDTQYTYTKTGDVLRSETITKDSQGELLESYVSSFEYSAPGRLHSSDVVGYDANNLLKSQAHYEHEPLTVCTEQKYYVPISNRPGKVVLCLAEFHDSSGQESRSIMYRPSQNGPSVSFAILDAFEIKDGRVIKQFKCDEHGNELGDNAPTKKSINFPSRKESDRD